jgi:hypothetical protein
MESRLRAREPQRSCEVIEVERAGTALRRRLRARVGRLIQWRERRTSLRYELAVCAIFREEAPFLDEWIAFHVGVGAQHFYLYNNFSTDNFRDVLKPWMARGLVTLIDWPRPVGQLSAYRHCLKRARRECRWLAFIDIDEFLFSPQSIDIRPILNRYADLPGLFVWQLFFGSNGHVSRPQVPVTTAYVKRASLDRVSAKTIANPRMVYRVGVHLCKYWLGEAFDTSRLGLTEGRQPVLEVLRINHYWSRSLEDLHVKIGRGDASTPQRRETDWHLAFESSLNAETDDAIIPVARAIRTAQRPSGGPGPPER